MSFVLAAALATIAAPAPAAQPVRIFADWVAGCDNGLRCQAGSLMPAIGGDEVEWAILNLRREAGPGARVRWWIALDDSLRPVDVAADGRRLRLPGFPLPDNGELRLTPAAERTLLAALARAGKLSLVDAQGKEMATFAAKGAAAALLSIDDRQGRIGTRGALLRPGTTSEARVARAPALPLIVTPRRSARPATPFPRGFAERRLRERGCDPPTPDTRANLIGVARLDDRTSLGTIALPCESGAYNRVVEAWLLRAGRPPERAGFRPAALQDDYNLSWVPAERRLYSGMKGRGLGDCGADQAWAWDGRAFRLSSNEIMPDCRGNADFISTFRAQLIER